MLFSMWRRALWNWRPWWPTSEFVRRREPVPSPAPWRPSVASQARRRRGTPRSRTTGPVAAGGHQVRQTLLQDPDDQGSAEHRTRARSVLPRFRKRYPAWPEAGSSLTVRSRLRRPARDLPPAGGAVSARLPWFGLPIEASRTAFGPRPRP